MAKSKTNELEIITTNNLYLGVLEKNQGYSNETDIIVFGIKPKPEGYIAVDVFNNGEKYFIEQSDVIQESVVNEESIVSLTPILKMIGYNHFVNKVVVDNVLKNLDLYLGLYQSKQVVLPDDCQEGYGESFYTNSDVEKMFNARNGYLTEGTAKTFIKHK